MTYLELIRQLARLSQDEVEQEARVWQDGEVVPIAAVVVQGNDDQVVLYPERDGRA